MPTMIARQNLRLNLVPGGVLPVLNASQYDSGYDVHFTLYNGSELFDIPDDVAIRLEETKTDGYGFTIGATKSDTYTGQCYIWMAEQMTAVAGDQICELVLTNTSERRIGTANFILRVERAAMSDDTVISDSQIAYASQVVNQLGTVAAYGEALNAVEANRVKRFDNVSEMTADYDLEPGMYVITGGYHAVNDGGSALYRIYYGIPTGQYYETLANGLYAVLIMSDTVCPEMFGAVGDGSTNDTTALLSAVNSGRTVIGNKKYKINPEQSFSGKKLKNLHLYFESNAALTSAVVFNNCVIEGCTFESVNDKPSPWNGASGNFSNIFISSNGSEFTGCTFKNLEYLSLGADGEIISGCRFVGCAGGISGNHSNHVRIINCIFDLLTYAGELEHAIYTSNDCSDWVIDGISVTGCQYYPLHIYNSHEGDNPKNITVANSSFYDAKWVVANNGDLNIVNCHFDNSDNNIERLLFANGTTKFKNCDIDVSNVLFILSGDKGVTFENCSIKCEDLVAAFGTSTSEKVTLTIKNCTMNVKRISRYDRSVELRSYNNVYNDIALLINNTDPSVLADLFFSNDVFNGDGDLIYANHFTLVMLGCYINRDTAAFIIASRSTTSGNTAFMSNNTARVSGNYITYGSGITNLGKNNCFNINP